MLDMELQPMLRREPAFPGRTPGTERIRLELLELEGRLMGAADAAEHLF